MNDDLNEISKYLLSLRNSAKKPLLNDSAQTSRVQLFPDIKITSGKFKKSNVQPNTYYAHPLTIRAVKKDLFMAGEGFEDLEDLIECQSCKKPLDRQFWHFCPYCESGLAT